MPPPAATNPVNPSIDATFTRSVEQLLSTRGDDVASTVLAKTPCTRGVHRLDNAGALIGAKAQRGLYLPPADWFSAGSATKPGTAATVAGLIPC